MARSVTVTSTWPDMLGGIASESKRVVAAHSRHFLALSVLFLLPLSSLLVAAPSFLFSSSTTASVSSSPPSFSLLRLDLHLPGLSTPSIVALYFSAAILLFLSAAAAVSGSVHRGFYGRPVKLLASLRSLPAPLAGLVLTLAAALLPLAAIFLLLASLLVLSFKALDFLHLSPSFSPYIYSLFAAVAVISLILLQLHWSLAGVIAILESSWGFAPLQRSAALIKMMRLASLCIHLFFEIAIGLTLWGCSLGKVGKTEGDWSEVVPVVARTIFALGITTVMFLYWMVTGVVLYMYCKALHGELAREIAEEFAWEYVFLPFDERKVPHVVSVIRQ
ncbi:hypothetical protein Cni_G00337 [Canna indica]|uniref:Uncharacterized protein n=1 Tax=Canna indica TaxID=4628 RepID=A0AAQ3JMJ1_9LILI|nr:hypothetical protein Cni_G00337 [Canna indica]